MWRAVARELGASFAELAHDLWCIEKDGARTVINNHQLELDNPVVLQLAANKSVVHKLLRQAGLQVPRHLTFDLSRLPEAYRFAEKCGVESVVKPADGYGGKGVTTHIRSERELRQAAILASLYSKNLLIEEQVAGECYRVLVFRGEAIHCVGRRGPRVRGDGKSTIRELIRQFDTSRIRDDGKSASLDIDRDCTFTLGYQGLRLDSVPKYGQEVLVKSINDPRRKQVEVRTVYNEDATDLVCDSIKSDAIRAASLVGSEFAGVDVITTDPTVPLEASGGAINEVNTTPALHHHYQSISEEYPGIALHIISSLLVRKKPTLGLSVAGNER